ncbi:hypothetical protein [Mucilaginibacter sp. dw_454]|uniref:hypothetical protein n=1 Tax=Mucilaginibacter sp. dw_454 TaxID=2720079 RepID=UPI001BD308BD|nr:hypothetical protein [Mucilaginibacter sp. dw_454]
MERHVLKEQLKTLIGDRKVKAALFYTFNFDPYFFENYVMPLLLPGKVFRDEAIYNHILWRRCAKEGLIPPVTVYCDHYAKNNTMAPTLGYQVRCVRLKGKRNLVNFHPKECWLLLEGGELIQVNGSANLTSSGWCDNLECCAVQRFYKNSFPKTVAQNQRQRMLQNISDLSAEQQLSEAEAEIQYFLRYTDETDDFFSSLETSFRERINELVDRYQPERIEVIAPYMYGEGELIDELWQKGFKQICCLVPSMKTNEVLLSKEVFTGMMEKGVAWCAWKDQVLAHEPRNLHAKIYRLYGSRKTITVTGSVNFTGPAWRKCTSDDFNEANVESAMIHVEDFKTHWLEPLHNIDLDLFLFLTKEDLETTEKTDHAGRNAPLLNFTINWKTNHLSCTGKLQKGQRIRFKSLLLERELTRAKETFTLQSADIKQLSKNALIELVDLADPGQIFAYYPCQLEIERRPLNFKLDPDTILNFWLSGDDPYVEDELSGTVAEAVTDESGNIDPEKFETPSLLNMMARHFTALISLEKRLFDQQHRDRTEQFHALRYYLLTENLDTLPFYLKGIREMAEKQQGVSFLWMIQQLLMIRFYERALAWPYKNAAGGAWRSFKTAVAEKRAGLLSETDRIAGSVTGLKEKAEWFTEQIRIDHG